MHRPTRTLLLAALWSLASLASLCSAAQPARPGILLLFADAQRDDTLLWFNSDNPSPIADEADSFSGYDGQPHGFLNHGRANGRYAETLAAMDGFFVSPGCFSQR